MNNPGHNCFDYLVHSHLVGHLPVNSDCIDCLVDNRLSDYPLVDYDPTNNDHRNVANSRPEIGPTDSDPQDDRLGVVSILPVLQLY